MTQVKGWEWGLTESTVQLTSHLYCLHSAALLMLDAEQFYLLGWIQTSQEGGQLSSDTFPYGECYLGLTFTLTKQCMTHQQQSPSAVFMRWPTFECGNNHICLEHKSEGINQGPRKKIFRFEWKRETHDWASQIEKKKNWIIKYGNNKSTV